MPSFIENVNKLAEKLNIIVESNALFGANIIPILEEIAKLDLKDAIQDLRKGNYLGNRKIDINLALNRQGITEDLIEEYPEQAEIIWTDLSGVVLYDRCDVTFVDGEVITINFEFDGSPISISTHGDLLFQLSSNSAFLAKLEGTLISGFNWAVVGEIVRIYDVIGQNSNIERIQLHAVSGDYIEQNPMYYWAKTSSSFQTLSMRSGDIIKLGNDIDSIILLANRINEILELHARIPELVDTYTGGVPNNDLTVYNALDELMAIYAELEALVTVYNDIKPIGTNYIQSVATDLQGVNNIGTVAGDLNLGIGSNINLVGSNIGDVVTVSNNIANVNIVSADISSVNTVSTDIANINSVATNVVPNITDILLGNTIKGVILSTYNSFSEAISNANTLGKSLIIDQPVDLGGATVDCLGVGLVWLSEGNIISNGNLISHSPESIQAASNQQIFGADLSVQFSETGTAYVSWFGDNTTSTPIQLAINSLPSAGGTVMFTTDTHTMVRRDGLYSVDINKSNITVSSTVRTELIPNDATDVFWFWFSVGTDPTTHAHSKVHNIRFENLVLSGESTSSVAGNIQFGIAFQEATDSSDYDAETDGSYNVTVKNCKITGFNTGVYAKGVKNITVNNCIIGENVYVDTINSQGYGILTESCSGQNFKDNLFISGVDDRHAIYVSIDTTNTNAKANPRNVLINGNTFDWGNTDIGANISRGAIALRVVKELIVTDNIILNPMYFGITMSGDGGLNTFDGEDINISNNIIKGVRNGTYGIGFNEAQFNNIVVTNNIITEATTGTAAFSGIQFGLSDNVMVGGNNIKTTGSAASGIYFRDSATNVVVKPNVFDIAPVAPLRGALVFTGNFDNFTISKQNKGTASLTATIGVGTVTNINYDFPLIVDFESDGAGAGYAVTFGRTDFISNIYSHAYGFTGVWATLVKPSNPRIEIINRKRTDYTHQFMTDYADYTATNFFGYITNTSTGAAVALQDTAAKLTLILHCGRD